MLETTSFSTMLSDFWKSSMTPRNELEALIVALWSQQLDKQRIGMHDDFFTLGGNLAQAQEISSHLAFITRVDISIHDFTAAPTIAQLAALVTRKRIEKETQQGTLHTYTRQQQPDGTILLPATLSQQGQWFIDQLRNSEVASSISITLTAHKHLDREKLQRCLNTLVQRHEALRTTFTMRDGQTLMQVITPEMPIPIVSVHRNAQPALSDALHRPFSLEHGPLLRASLQKKDYEEDEVQLIAHRIVCDEWSMHLLISELTALYEADSLDQSVTLPVVPFQFADFTSWQQEWMQSNAFTQHMAFWKEQLANAFESLDLPTDHPRRAQPSNTNQSNSGATYQFTLSQTLSDAVKSRSNQEHITPFMLLLTSFSLFLQRYTGQDDLLIGTNSSDRTLPGSEGIVGDLSDTLVVHTNLAGNPTVKELLANVREWVLLAQDHQDVPFDSIVKTLQQEYKLEPHQLFQVFFTFTSHQFETMSGWEVTQVTTEDDTILHDIALELTEEPQGIVGTLKYRSDLFDEQTIANMVVHWQVLLAGMIAEPTALTSDLPMLTEAEQQRMLIEWNDTAATYPADRCIHEIIEEQAARTPDAVALSYEGTLMSYGELNKQANRLAHHLQQQGIGPDVLVGLCIERSIEFFIGMLGILKAGAAYVPTDPSYPADRLAFMFNDADVPVLLTVTSEKEKLAQLLPNQDTPIFCIDSDLRDIDYSGDENVSSEVKPDNLAYMIYTSGSTGNPKGVLITHRSLVNSTYERCTYYPERVTSNLLDVPMAFDGAIANTYWTLCQGGELVLPKVGELDIDYLTRLFVERKVSHLQGLPKVYSLFIDQENAQEKLASLRLALVAAEPCPVELIEKHYRLFPNVELYNEYGPTEGTVWSTVYNYPRQGLQSPSIIGRPISNVQIYILDALGRPVPVGVPGEIHIGGTGLARGYHNRPDLTDQRFIISTFQQGTSVRLYKTGDLARYKSDGSIEFLGRVDHQIKINGFRVELGEVENALKQRRELKEVLVVAREDVPGNKRLVAYLIATEQEQKPSATSLRETLQERLPDYMIPSAFVYLDEFPLMPNGKTNLRALPAPAMEQGKEEGSFVAPSSITHYQLLNIWEELLNIKDIGIQDNFFTLGADSLLAARLVIRIEQVFGKKILLPTLLAKPTIEDLAKILDGNSYTARSLLTPIQTVGKKRPFFFLHGDATGGAFYCFALSQAMGKDQPFYALEPPYEYDEKQSLPTIPHLAAMYLKVIREVQPEGPYSLGGYCNGALVAYEMAQQLHEVGQEVDYLGMIDPALAPAMTTNQMMYRMVEQFGKVARLGDKGTVNIFLRLRHILRLARLKLRPSEEDLKDFSTLAAEDPGFKRLLPGIKTLQRDFVAIFSWISQKYIPSFYQGKLTFYWSEDLSMVKEAWLKKVGLSLEQENYDLPGTHRSILTAQINLLSNALSEGLNNNRGPQAN
jgi:amino acid adenylation domain-containing protein